MEFYKPIYKCVTAISDIKSFLDNDKPVAFDFETSPDELYRREEKAALDAHKSHIVGISFSVSEGESIYVPLIHNSGDNADNQEELWSFFRLSVFENRDRVKIFLKCSGRSIGTNINTACYPVNFSSYAINF